MSTKVIALALITASFSTVALAQAAPAANGRVLSRVEHRLNITPQQREQARTILLQEQPKLQQLRQSLASERSEMNSASSTSGFDATAARAVQAKYADANAEAAVEREKLRAEFLAILTPEQKEKLQQLRARLSAAFGSGLPGVGDVLGDTL